MVNLHTCHVCGETVYFHKMNGIWYKKDPNTKGMHQCNTRSESSEEFFDDVNLTARKYKRPRNLIH